MDTIRYWIGLMVVMCYPVGLLLWLAIHPFAVFWRKLGSVWTYLILSIPSLLFMGGIYLLRKKIMTGDFGTHYPLLGLAVVFMILGTIMIMKRRRFFNYSQVTGIPEISRVQYPGKLITDGPYALIRNPRYLEMALFTLGYVLLANYLAPYVVYLLSLPLVYLVVILEERELRRRFGKEYDEYCRRVPRFIPRKRIRS